MAKAKDKSASGDKKKKKSVSKSAVAKSSAKPGKGTKKSKASDSSLDALAKFANHPLVADLLAVGAMAAVAAVAEHNKPGKTAAKAGHSTRTVKAAGKAAATAIGQRLLTEVTGLNKATKPN